MRSILMFQYQSPVGEITHKWSYNIIEAQILKVFNTLVTGVEAEELVKKVEEEGAGEENVRKVTVEGEGRIVTRK